MRTATKCINQMHLVAVLLMSRFTLSVLPKRIIFQMIPSNLSFVLFPTNYKNIKNYQSLIPAFVPGGPTSG